MCFMVNEMCFIIDDVHFVNDKKTTFINSTKSKLLMKFTFYI